MLDTDPVTEALRELPVLDLAPGKARAILARAEALLAKPEARTPWLDVVWARFVGPTLVTAMVASYLVWAVTAASALYR